MLRLADYPLTWVKIGDYQIASREEYPWRDTWPFVELLRERFGAGRMLWGTGYPRTRAPGAPGAGPALRAAGPAPSRDAERRQILWETPAALFGFA